MIERRGGEVAFADFMQLALYHPEHGYYSGDQPRYGRSGDFLTAPTASPWYARVLARLFADLAAEVGPLTLVDLAAGDGSFIRTLREELDAQKAATLSRIVLVEQSAAMRRRLADAGGGRAEVVESLDQAQPAEGPVVLHASELYDAMPVDRVVAAAGGLEEMWVAVEDERLVWKRRPARDELVAYFEGHGVVLAQDQVAEANRHAAAAHAGTLRWAGTHGLDLVLDYGYGARRLYNPRGRAQGSLVCFHRHEMSRDPLHAPGSSDITAHVNWDDLRNSARAAGWREIGCFALAELLVRAGLADVLEQHGLGEETELDARVFSHRQEVKRLLDPDGMGADLKVLVHACGEIAEVVERSLSV